MAGKAEIDVELKKAFIAQQQRVIETRQKLRLSDMQIDGMKMDIRRSELTDREMAALPDDTVVYESVGHAFFLESVAKVRQNIDGKVKASQEKIKKLEANKNYLERTLKDGENNLREMVQQRKEMSSH
ncbi:prefoldin subunit 1 [Neocloeon triangulifer]|uniref:prefoldin subunit 1 n=1 Tax=Neocloeon triangulifer TaxID=2078957 RepID=UPI00286ED7E2|nr:prefoldin subunit 1 [Neocloeon triangulifer]